MPAAEGSLPPDPLTPGDLAPASIGEPVIAHDYGASFAAADGRRYAVRAYSQGRTDGTWIGWLVFAGVDGETIIRTPRETTQRSAEQVARWAAGLQHADLTAALRRAT